MSLRIDLLTLIEVHDEHSDKPATTMRLSKPDEIRLESDLRGEGFRLGIENLRTFLPTFYGLAIRWDSPVTMAMSD